MCDSALQRGVNFRLRQLAFMEEEGFHVLDQKLLMFRVDCAETEMVDELVLFCHPLSPATLTNVFVNALAQRVAERCSRHARQFVSTTGTSNRSHQIPQAR
jgi:hypothetical protein